MEKLVSLLIVCLLMQWVWAIAKLTIGNDYTSKLEFIIEMIPGYFLVSYAKGIWYFFQECMTLD